MAPSLAECVQRIHASHHARQPASDAELNSARLRGIPNELLEFYQLCDGALIGNGAQGGKTAGGFYRIDTQSTACPGLGDPSLVIQLNVAMKPAWKIIRLLLVAYLSFLLLMLFFERSLIFFPTKFPSGHWNAAALKIEDAWFNAEDGPRLHGWFAESEKPTAVILFCHGNGGNITHRADILRMLSRNLQASVLMFDYRGYGRSDGIPSEEGVLQDARTARAWLAERTSTRTKDIVLMGESLGGAVACDLAASDGARALVLQSTFSSLPDVASYYYPWLPVKLLMRNRFNAAEAIKNYTGPLLQSHSIADEIIPYRFGKDLFEQSPSTNKKWVEIKGRSHNDPYPESYYLDDLKNFLKGLSAVSAS